MPPQGGATKLLRRSPLINLQVLTYELGQADVMSNAEALIYVDESCIHANVYVQLREQRLADSPYWRSHGSCVGQLRYRYKPP